MTHDEMLFWWYVQFMFIWLCSAGHNMARSRPHAARGPRVVHPSIDYINHVAYSIQFTLLDFRSLSCRDTVNRAYLSIKVVRTLE